jgi:hypothetical protein
MSELHAGLQRYRELIVADEDLSFTPPKTGVRITYLGTNGYLLQSRDSALLIDLAILGVALPDSRRYFIQALEQLRPRYVLPSHQDDFFSPLSRGFVFGPMTNFPAVLRSSRQASIRSRLILLDYFRPGRFHDSVSWKRAVHRHFSDKCC